MDDRTCCKPLRHGRARAPRPSILRAALVLVAALATPTPAAAQGSDTDPRMLQGFPMAVLCTHAGTSDLYYLGQIREDGSALYRTLGGRRAGIVTAGGPAEAVGDLALGSCQGKTLRQLRDEGRTIEWR